MVKFRKGEKEMEIIIGTPFELRGEQIAGVIAYKLTLDGFDVSISSFKDASVVYVRKHYQLYNVTIKKEDEMTVPYIEKLIEGIKKEIE